MPQPPTWEPDISKTDLSATRVLGASPAGASAEPNFEHLAATLAQSGGGLSAELSNDLALEIVLNEIVVQACVITGAAGAAVALERDGEMICRGSNGSTAPALGSRLDAASPLAAECIRTRKIQRSDDVLADVRVDLAAAQRVGARSIVVKPLLQKDQLVGLFQLFSSLPLAFGERDERTLETLAQRIYTCLDTAAKPLPMPAPAQSASSPNSAIAAFPVEGSANEISENEIIKNEISENESLRAQSVAVSYSKPDDFKPDPAMLDSSTLDSSTLDSSTTDSSKLESSMVESSTLPSMFPENATAPENSSASGFDAVTFALSAAVVVCAILLGLLLGRHMWTATAPIPVARPHPGATSAPKEVPATAAPAAPAVNASAAGTPESPTVAAPSVQPSVKSRERAAPLPAGGLQVFENGKEIFRMPPTRHEADDETAESTVQRASSGEPDKPLLASGTGAAGGSLVYRVEPQYPKEALQKRIQGPVVLDVHIGPDGLVQNVQSVSGPPELAQASIDAVVQWKFKPHRVNGRPAPMQTRVTLNFKLPQ